MRRASFFIAAALALCLHANAQVIGTPKAPDAGIVPQQGAALPLDMPLVDSDGARLHLGDFFGDKRPVLLVLGYYRCPQLCGLLMHGLLEALHQSHLSRSAVRIVAVSIDPQDSPATARTRRDADLGYARFLAQGEREVPAPDLHLLVAGADDIAKLTRRVGFEYSRTEAGDARFAHPAAIVVATAQGRISRYLNGIRFDSADLRTAVADASGNRISGIERVGNTIALLCAHVDPNWGRHSAAILDSLRVGGVLLAFGLGAWCWRRRSPATEPHR